MVPNDQMSNARITQTVVAAQVMHLAVAGEVTSTISPPIVFRPT